MSLLAAHIELHRDLIEQKFWSKVNVGAQDECWLWKSERDYYGKVKLPKCGPQVDSHKLAYILANGAVPQGLVVRHSCDVKRCCNPKHLLLGTKHDNILDAVERRQHAFGERIGQSVLKDPQIVEIREQFAQGYSHREIARTFGVNRRTVGLIVRRQAWKHV